MDAIQLLTEAFSRVPEVAHRSVTGLTSAELGEPPEPGSNPIAWLVWHLARQQDTQVAQLAGREQVWVAQGWHERSGLPFAAAEMGFGQDADAVRTVGRAGMDAAFLTGYLDAVHAASIDYLHGLSEQDLDAVVDEAWDPPVTAGVRLLSIADDGAQHAGQAAYLRGLLDRR